MQCPAAAPQSTRVLPQAAQNGEGCCAQVAEALSPSLLCSLVNTFLWVDLFFMLFFALEIGIQIWVKGVPPRVNLHRSR